MKWGISTMSFATLVPLAVVMVAGPQIISAIMLATSENARKNSLGYVCGAMLSTLLATSVFYFAAGLLHAKAASGDSSPSSKWLDWIFVAVLVAAALRVYLRRADNRTPKWMGKLESATPWLSLRIGFLLFLLMPTDLMMTFTVGVYLGSHGLPLAYAAGFWLLTLIFISLPLLLLLLMGKRAGTVLPKMRTWMNSNSWIVSEVVIGFFLAMELQSIFGG